MGCRLPKVAGAKQNCQSRANCPSEVLHCLLTFAKIHEDDLHPVEIGLQIVFVVSAAGEPKLADDEENLGDGGC